MCTQARVALVLPEPATAQRRPTPTGAIESLEPSLGFAALRAAFGPIAAAHLADPGIDPLNRYIAGLIQCDAAKVDTCKTASTHLFDSTRRGTLRSFGSNNLTERTPIGVRIATSCWRSAARSRGPFVWWRGRYRIRIYTHIFASDYTIRHALFLFLKMRTARY